MSKNIPTIIITGPTASGKTKLSLELAKNNNGEIINADIMQMYEGFNILKAMPSTEEKFEIKHYLFGVIKKETKFTVADWIKLAKDKISEIHEKGKIFIDGKIVDGSPAGQDVLRNNVGMVFQQFNLFPHLTILENLMLGPVRARQLPESEARDLAMQYLERVRIPEQLDKYPAQLSGGQQQRVAIARALCMMPKIMLFDEPTSALDPEMIAEVLDVIEELADSGMTMICVTHEMGFARQVADMMLFMDHGKIVETGPPKKFFTAPKSDRCKLFLSQIL